MFKPDSLIFRIAVIAVMICIFCTGTVSCSFTDQARQDESVINKDHDKDDNADQQVYNKTEGITNILLIGTDSREDYDRGRSDTIIIATVDNQHKKIKLTSIMRDTYVDIPGHSSQKINHSFYFGGPQLLTDTIEQNLDIKLDNYAIVDFYGLVEVVDILGGIEVDIKDYEVNEMNRCIKNNMNELKDKQNKDSSLLDRPGVHNLDGTQTLAYTRIRKVGNGDFERAERQRKVILLLAEKLKQVPIAKYPSLITKFMPYVQTNMSIKYMADLAYTACKMDEFSPEQLQIPVNEISRGRRYGQKGWVLFMDAEQNAKILKDFIYNDKGYDEDDIDVELFQQKLQEYQQQD
ncbi:MAG: LCP family protein [Clostridia bacterium]|nr:LCP family protein [Clostridia bacterium]